MLYCVCIKFKLIKFKEDVFIEEIYRSPFWVSAKGGFKKTRIASIEKGTPFSVCQIN